MPIGFGLDPGRSFAFLAGLFFGLPPDPIGFGPFFAFFFGRYLAEAIFFGYVFVVGRQAAAAGEDGDVDARYLEDRVATRA